MKVISWILLAIASLAALWGCGGGGGSSSGSGSNSTTLFITDDLNTGYDHVWVTIKQVTLSKTGGTSKTIFSDSTGVTVDLKTLRDNQGRRFRFMCLEDHTGGTYDTVNVVLDQNLVLYTTGSTTGLNRVFDGASGGLATLSASLPATTGAHQDLVVDFNLSNWTDDGTSVTGSIAVVTGDNSIHDPDRHEHDNYPGTVSNLAGTAPSQTFTLTHGDFSVTVQTDSSTTITRSDNTSNPVLANGQHVVVRGTFDTTTSTLTATDVLITGNTDDGSHAEARGTASNINAGSGTLDLTVTDADRFVPAADPIHIATSGTTEYRDGTGADVTQAEFFADVADGNVVEAEGSYDSASNTLTAARLRLGHGDDDHGGGNHENNARVEGATSLVDAAAGTFTVTSSHFCGLNISIGAAIPVTTSGTTVFKGLGEDAGTITSTAFFTALTSTAGQQVEVEGHWDGTTLVATKCRLGGDL